jgi:signal transduction histidine kinase
LLRISDDGIGFSLTHEQTFGLGLVSMKERLKSIQGSIEIISRQKKGTIVEASVPAQPKKRPWI